MDAAVGATRLVTGWTPRALIDALVVATCIAAVVVEGAAGVGTWHLVCLASVVGVVVLVRLQRPVQRHRLVEASMTAAVALQPTSDVLGEVWHRAATGQSPGSGAAHVGLLGLHLTLAAVLFVGLLLADVLVLALAGVVHQIVRLLAALRGAPPTHRPARVMPTRLVVVGQSWPWPAYALRRGPPWTPSSA